MSEINLTPDELEAMLDRAARRGAKEVLHQLGLHDESAATDLREMRSLLDTWKDTRRSIWNTFIKITTVAILSFIATAVYMQLGKQ
jgi:2-iminoacetate synthase ThiH